MKAGSWKVFFIIFIATLLIFWGAGMLIVRNVLPRWAMILVNPPFGAVYAWTEGLWQKTNYVFNGQIVDEGLVMAAQLLAVIAQAVLFYLVWLLWRRRSNRLSIEG